MTHRTPLYARHEAAGARFVEFAGYDMPVRYGSATEEHLRVRRAVGLFDVSHMGEVRVTGPAAAAALDHLMSHRIGTLVPGRARYTLMCTPEGGVVDDLVVYRLAEEAFLVCTNAANHAVDFAWMVEHGSRDGATFTDEASDWVQIAVQGPAALATLSPLTDLPIADLAFFGHAPATVAGVGGCLVARTGYTGEDGFEVFAPAQGGVAVWDALLAAGAAHDVAPIGLAARDTLRLEARLPLYGHELTRDTSPRMAGLMWTAKVDKPGGFLGSDAIVAREATDTHRLCGLILDGKRVARQDMRVQHDGADVGWITSGAFSPTREQSIALAYLRADLAVDGVSVEVDLRGKLHAAVTHTGPFYARPR